MTRRLLATALFAALPLGSVATATQPAAASDGSDGPDNVAVVVNTKDGSTKFKVKFKITRANGDVITTTNAAVAFASCTDCRTVAIAFQVLLLAGDPSVVSPTNIAIAINEGCTDCETLASAYQYVLSTDSHVRFTRAGRAELRAIRKELKDLEKADLSIEEIQARLDELANRLLVVLTSEIVTVHENDDGQDVRGHPFEDPTDEDGEPLPPVPTEEPPDDTPPSSTTTTDPSTTTTTTTTTPNDTTPTTVAP